MNTILFSTAGIACAAALLAAAPARAQVEAYRGEVQLYANGYCPKYAIETDGQTLPIPQNQALYAVMGTTYGGDGRTNFNLPDLRGRSVLGHGQGPGRSEYRPGQAGGAEWTTLTTTHLPPHTHDGVLRGLSGPPDTDSPAGASLADFPTTNPVYQHGKAPDTDMAQGSIFVQFTGRSQRAPILSPYQTMRYCLFREGIHPSPPPN